MIHRHVEREVLVRHATDEATQDRVLKVADEAARAQWLFLDGVYKPMSIRRSRGPKPDG